MIQAKWKKIKEVVGSIAKVIFKIIVCSLMIWVASLFLGPSIIELAFIQCVGISIAVLAIGALLRGMKI